MTKGQADKDYNCLQPNCPGVLLLRPDGVLECSRCKGQWWPGGGELERRYTQEERADMASRDANTQAYEQRRQRILSAVGGRYTEVLPSGSPRWKGGASKSSRKRRKPLRRKKWYQED